MGSIVLVIVHPDRLVRESLTTALAQQDGFRVVHSSDGRDISELIETVRARRPDIVLLDSGLARGYGAQLIAEVKSAARGVRVLVTGVPDCDDDVLEMIELGAAGYETHDASLCKLVSNIRALKCGQTVCCPRIVTKLFSRVARQPQALTSLRGGRDGPRLTRRELQIIALIDAGLPNKEIARRLSIEVQTVKNHVHNILDKLQVHRRMDAARCARARGLLPPGIGTGTRG
ncbi:MAG: LuxR C-terminal-related transcriptional regulator [Woeseiaceae bacterium]